MRIYHYLGKKFKGKKIKKEEPMNYLVPFQQKHGLTPDGVVGKKTLNKFKEVYNLTTYQTAHFVGQLAHETANFKYAYENLNYSESGLRRVFIKYFPTQELRKEYARKPEKIANRVYANRGGNGDEQSGDGWAYRGRGGIQTTLKDNYKALSQFLGKDVIENPDLVATDYYFESALFYFKKHNIFDKIKDVRYETIKKVTRAINGGYNGLQDRYNRTKYYNSIIS